MSSESSDELSPKRRRLSSSSTSHASLPSVLRGYIEYSSASSEKLYSNLSSIRESTSSPSDEEEELVFMNNRYKDTKLHMAIKAENLQLVKQILDFGVNVNAPGNDGDTPLHVAVKKGFSLAVKCLVEYGANISGKMESDDDSFWETPLHLAVKSNRLDILKLLLTTEINVKELRKNSDKHLHNAIKGKNFKLINHLAGVSTVDYNKTMQDTFKNFSIHMLSKLGYSDDLKTLLFGKCTEINARNTSDETLLLLAVKNNNLEIIKYLLENGADINAHNYEENSPGWTALHAAADLSSVDAVDLLLAHENCDVNVFASGKGTPLHLAASKSIEIVKRLVRRNAQLDTYGRYYSIQGLTPYHVAVRADKMAIVEFFLDEVKVDVDMTTLNGETALQIAARTENFQMVELLINHGANINHFSTVKNEHGAGLPALHVAAQIGNEKMVEFLLKKGANVHVAGSKNKSVLHMAVCGENENVVKLLLAHKAEVNSRSTSERFEGTTPLLEAASRNLKDVILMLIFSGADLSATAVNFITKQRESVIDFAIKGLGDAELLRMLLNLGADINKASIIVHDDLPESVYKILKEHVHKLKAAALDVSEENWMWAGWDWDKHLDREVQRMKDKKIRNSNVSFYDLLVKDLDQVVKYAENKDIRKAIKLEELKYLFPNYADLLVCYFNKGLKRSQLLNDAERALQDIFAGLPHDCVRTILFHLNNDELMVICSQKT